MKRSVVLSWQEEGCISSVYNDPLAGQDSGFPAETFINTTLDGNTPTQLHIDFRTQRPTAIDFRSSTADQRAACAALNRERTCGILEAAQLAPSRESFPVDVLNAIFARKSKQKGVPLIPLERLGIHHDEDGMLSSDFLVALLSGAEANPYRDDDWNAVYKFFFLGEGELFRLSPISNDRLSCSP